MTMEVLCTMVLIPLVATINRLLCRKKSGVTIGQRDKLSAIDIAEIRAYYGC